MKDSGQEYRVIVKASWIMLAKEDKDNLMSMLIDEKKEFAPAGIDETNGTVYSDHNTIMCDFNWSRG